MARVSVGIVLFFPNEERLIKNIDTIKNSTEYIYIYNNGSESELVEKLKIIEKVVMLGTGINKGIAFALNQILKRAKADAQEWVVTYDQDSLSTCDLIKEFERMIPEYKDAAILCPRVVDDRRRYVKQNITDSIELVDRCITSASCTNIDAWSRIGGFDDKLFIDLVDNDFCKRIRISGMEIVKNNAILLNQEFGNISIIDNSLSRILLKLSDVVYKLGFSYLSYNIGKLTYKKKVSPLRVYYTNRNVLYLNKKFNNYGGIGYECYRCNSYLGFQITFNLASVVRGRDKIKIIKAIFNGIRDGYSLAKSTDPLAVIEAHK